VTNTNKRATKRSLFRALASGVEAMREYRDGRLTLRKHQVVQIELPSPETPEDQAT
jgi:hypothetical protein